MLIQTVKVGKIWGLMWLCVGVLCGVGFVLPGELLQLCVGIASLRVVTLGVTCLCAFLKQQATFTARFC